MGGQITFDSSWPSIQIYDPTSYFTSVLPGDKIVATVDKTDASLNTEYNWGAPLYLKQKQKLDEKWYNVAGTDQEVLEFDQTNVEASWTLTQEGIDGIINSSVKSLIVQGTNLVASKVELEFSTPTRSSQLWTGECSFGNWAGFGIEANAFANAKAGDILEFTLSAETETWWQLQTIVNGKVLEGNKAFLNQDEVAVIPSAMKSYRIRLTEADVEGLKQSGMWCNGHYVTVTKVDLLRPYKIATNATELQEGDNLVNFVVRGVKSHGNVLYACSTTEAVNPFTHGDRTSESMDYYEDRDLSKFDQRDWVAIDGLDNSFEDKELAAGYYATLTGSVLTPSTTIESSAASGTYVRNTYRAENVLHGGYKGYAADDYRAFYIPVRNNEVAYFIGFIKTVNGEKYLYSNNKVGEAGVKLVGCTLDDNSSEYTKIEGVLVNNEILFIYSHGTLTSVEGVETTSARIFSADGNIVIAATVDGNAAIYDLAGRFIKEVPAMTGTQVEVPASSGAYIVRLGNQVEKVLVK